MTNESPTPAAQDGELIPDERALFEAWLVRDDEEEWSTFHIWSAGFRAALSAQPLPVSGAPDFAPLKKLATTVRNRAVALNASGDDDMEMLGEHYEGLAGELDAVLAGLVSGAPKVQGGPKPMLDHVDPPSRAEPASQHALDARDAARFRALDKRSRYTTGKPGYRLNLQGDFAWTTLGAYADRLLKWEPESGSFIAPDVEASAPAGAAKGGITIPCGGCGERDPDKRCIGCGHQFTPPDAPTPAPKG